MQHIVSHQAVMNAVAWIITLSGAVSFLASIVGTIYVLVSPTGRLAYSETWLHATYYVVAQRGIVLSLLLVAALSAAIAFIGFSRTHYFMRRTFAPLVEPSEKT